MTHRRISEATWRTVHEDWISCLDPVSVIAARHGMGVTTLGRRAKSQDWLPRGSGLDDPAALARRLYADITAELRVTLQALKENGSDEPVTTTNQRTALIRAHRRTLVAVLDARKPLARSSQSGDAASRGEDFPALDLVAAREDILARLARLDRVSRS